MAEDSKAAVYVAWPTMKNALDQLAQFLPNQIDRTYFTGLSGGVQSQLFAGLKFLGLMDDDSKPTETLRLLAVPDEAKRKERFKALLQERYSDVFAIDLLKTTPGELSNKIGDAYNVTGDTKEKALRFFLGAIGYAGIPISKAFDKQYGTGNGKTRRRSPSKTRASSAGDEPDDDLPQQRGTSRTVNLKGGGTLTLSASIDIFQLKGEDRTFVFKLIDELDAYDQK